jgi:hypothetical protein
MPTEQTAAPTTAPNVEYILPAVTKAKPVWTMIRDCVDGQSAIKAKGTEYLPMPNPADLSIENTKRYDAYKSRGLFANLTARTLNGLVGTAFAKEPVVTLPAAVEMLFDNIDGGAVSMDQQAKQALADVCSVGRCGILTDFPTVDSFVTRQQVNNGEVRPVILFYFAEDIINWRYTMVNSLRKLSLVVLAEKYVVTDDGFEEELEDQWRVLMLIDNVYTVRVYRNSEAGIAQAGTDIVPLQNNRKPFDYIPFEFIGSRNNDGGVDESPLAGIADINVAHYRNSCDFEEMVFNVGQPTPVITGLTEAWAQKILKGQVVLGSTRSLLLPEGADAKYLEVTESQLAQKAMEHKEQLAVAIGARLVNQNTVQRTATEAGIDDAAESSVLLAAVNNVNSAYTRAIRSACLFAGAPVTADTGYAINTDFEIMQLDQAALAARVKMWVDGAITFTEVRAILKRAGIATLEDDAAREEMQKDAADNAAAMGLGNPAEPIMPTDNTGDNTNMPPPAKKE